jgi:hypothetical protein
MTARTFTYQSRIVSSTAQSSALDAYAGLYGRIERTLFARMVATGRPAGDFKNGLLKEYGLSARQFNAIRVGLEGKIKAILARRPELIEELGRKIARARKTIGKIAKRLATAKKNLAKVIAARSVYVTRRPSGRVLRVEEAREAVRSARGKLHQKKRRLGILENRHARLAQDQRQGRIGHSSRCRRTVTETLGSGARNGVLPAAPSSSGSARRTRRPAISPVRG